MIFFSPARAQRLHLDLAPMGGKPYSLSGSNKSTYGAVAGRLQLSYRPEISFFEPYASMAIGATEFPLANKNNFNLRMPVLNASVSLGLQHHGWENEFNGSAIIIGGGIGVCSVRPDASTLNLDGNETYLTYNTLQDQSWFPKAELTFRLQRYPKQDIRWYMGLCVSIEAVWLKDAKTRFTTRLNGEEYNLSFRNHLLIPMAGGIVGFSF